MKFITSTESNLWYNNDNVTQTRGYELKIGETSGKPLFGFGCCISEICAKAVLNLDEDKQKEIFDTLFGEDDMGFKFCRLAVGANDFAESWYSYNETEGDYEMKNFSIARDEKYIIPAIKEAMKRSPDLEFFASPWSPPTWMKFPKAYNYGKIVETPENLKAYAVYFRKFVEEYAKRNIKIAQIHVQNEFVHDAKFPSCVWTGKTMENFIANYLSDELDGLCDLWFGTINSPVPDRRLLTSRMYQYMGLVMQNPKCRQSIKGASFQWDGKFAITQAAEDYPQLDFINSEMECGDGKNEWQYAIYTGEMMHHYFKFGARACVYWNMALENDGLSTWGWNQNSLISVKDGDFTYNPEYYLIRHFAKYVKKGAVMKKTEGLFSSVSSVFQNPDGTIAAVIMNPYDTQIIITIKNKNFILEPRSFNTIVM